MDKCTKSKLSVEHAIVIMGQKMCLGKGNEPQSEKIRNYAMAGFFIAAAMVALLVFFSLAATLSWNADSPNIWSECSPDTNSANVFVGAASNDLKNVKCIAVEKEFFANPEISIGDLSKNDNAVCKFKLTKNAGMPLSFEISYNDKTRKEVCNWWNQNNID